MGKRVSINIARLLEKEGISIRELSRRTDIRHPTLIEILNGKRQRIQFEHIEKIAEEFNITDINEIISIETVEDK